MIRRPLPRGHPVRWNVMLLVVGVGGLNMALQWPASRPAWRWPWALPTTCTTSAPHERPAMFALSNALLTCAGVGVAFLLGLAGSLHDIRAPLVVLILFNLAAALYVRRSFAD